jgi:hypothetical protein
VKLTKTLSLVMLAVGGIFPGAATGGPAPEPLKIGTLSVSGFEHAEVLEVTETVAHWGEVTSRSWAVAQGGIFKRVVEHRLGSKAPRTLAGYFRHWRALHGCTAKEVSNLPATRREPPLPEITFEGSCKGGDTYLMRVFRLGDAAYELHVDGPVGISPQKLRAAMLELLKQVAL